MITINSLKYISMLVKVDTKIKYTTCYLKTKTIIFKFDIT